MGYPAEEILRYADENDVDLILIAAIAALFFKRGDRGRPRYRSWELSPLAEES
jgi:nucleotide-binding universal stress UspA family protein